MKNRNLEADILLLLVSLIWAGTYSVDSQMVRVNAPFVYLSARFAVAVFLFAVIFRKSLHSITRETFWRGAVLGLFLYLEFLFQLEGLVYSSPSKMGFITGLFIVITPVFAIVLTGAKLTAENRLGVALAMAGFTMLALPAGGGINMGDFLGLAAAVSSALHILYMGIFVRRSNVNQLNTIQIGVTAALFILTAAITQTLVRLLPVQNLPAMLRPEAQGLVWTWSLPLSVFYTAVLATVVLFSLQARGQRYASATRTVIIFSLSPVFAAIIAYLTLGDWIGWRGYAGGILTVIGVIVSESRIFKSTRDAGEMAYAKSELPARGHGV